jgi:hypothetical protein
MIELNLTEIKKISRNEKIKIIKSKLYPIFICSLFAFIFGCLITLRICIYELDNFKTEIINHYEKNK